MKMNVPQLRFKGFNDAWQHRKIGEVMTVKAGGGVDKAKLKATGKYPVIANALTNDGIVGYYDDYQVKAPAVTITGRGALGHAVARLVNFTPIVRLLTARSATINVNFIANAINQLHIYNESTGVPQLTAVQLKTYTINYPTLAEQQRIGDFLHRLDCAINLQTRKITLLKQLKHGYLQKLFPQNGQTTPQLRFKGFNDEWQSKKLKDIGTTYSGLTVKVKDDFGHGKAHFITFLNVLTNPITSKKMLDKIEIDNKQHQVKKGDVFFNTSSETPEEVGMSSVCNFIDNNIYLNSFCFAYSPLIKFDNYFLA